MTQHAVLLGASKGCGYHALIRLLAPSLDWKATILLRKPEPIQNDPFLKTCMDEGRLRIVRGDATNYDDVVKLFGEKVDVVISTIGKSSLILQNTMGSELTDKGRHLFLDGGGSASINPAYVSTPLSS